MSVLNREQENNEGILEYKYQLLHLTQSQKDHLACQMKFRLEGGSDYGQAIYDLGLTDDGFPLGLTPEDMEASITSLREIVDSVPNYGICAIERHDVLHYAKDEQELIATFLTDQRFHGKTCSAIVDKKWHISKENKKAGLQEFKRSVAEIIIRRDVGKYWEIKIGIAGNVDCGKSSLLGVLVSGQYDNGRGKARFSIMKHKHEQDTGRTSSVSQEIVGFTSEGVMVNDTLAQSNPNRNEKLAWSSIVQHSSKVITFFDLAGHLDYLSQTIIGITSNELDYALIIIGANMSASVVKVSDKNNEKWTNMTLEHMDTCLALGIPCIVVVTKIDNTDPVVRKETVSSLQKLLNKRLVPYKVDTLNDVRSCVELMTSTKLVPIVQVSNVTGEGMDILKKLLHFLPPRKSYVDTESLPPVLQIQEIFRQVDGTSLIIAGMLTSGTVRVAEAGQPATVLTIGPFSDGTFSETRVKSLHVKKLEVSSATAGKYVCIGLPKSFTDKGGGLRVRKGMFAVDSKMKPKSTWEFWADIRLAKNKSSCINVGYTPTCHLGHIKQTCQLLEIYEQPDKIAAEKEELSRQEGNYTLEHTKPKSILSAGSYARVLLRFCFRPEMIFENDKTRLVFREGKTKGIGTILKTTNTVHEPIDNKSVTKNNKVRVTRRERREAKERELAAGIQRNPSLSIKMTTMKV